MRVWKTLVKFYHQCGSPPYFYKLAGRLMIAFGLIAIVLGGYGLISGLFYAPLPDNQGGDIYRLIYIHVPFAHLSLMIYSTIAIAGAIGLIWRMKMAFVFNESAAPLGAAFTLLTLITGAIWGKPTWGAYWLWQDARMVSELILLFFYIAYLSLHDAIEDKQSADQACSVLAIIGFAMVPIIHFSVDERFGFRTLHQRQTEMMNEQTMSGSIVLPLVSMIFAMTFFYFVILLMRMRTTLLDRERNKKWVKDYL